MYDVIIVGGGPAGLNAALILGRCRRKVLLCDAGRPRNAATPLTWGIFTRDGTPPAELRRLAHADLDRYATVERRSIEVMAARRIEPGFRIDLADGTSAQGRRLILATGLHQDVPDIEGFAELWGAGVHSCPYCDGFEVADQPIAAYGHGPGAKGFALELSAWSREVTLCTHGLPTELSDADCERLVRHGVRVVETPIRRLLGEDGKPSRLVFADGTEWPCKGVFLMPEGCRPSDLIRGLGCEIGASGTVPTRDYERTNVPGLFVAGDASRRVQFAVVAAAEGAMAAFAANADLLREDTR